MPWTAYSRLSHPVPYVMRLSACGGELLYFGSRHTYDSGDPELEQIDAEWSQFAPTLALNEGGNFRSTGNRETDVKEAGEAGLLRYLAETRNVQVKTPEPAPEAEARMLREHRFADEQIKTFYVLRQVAELAPHAAGQSIDAYAARMLDTFAQTHDLHGSPSTLAEPDVSSHRYLPALSDWRRVDTTWFDPFPDRENGYTNAMSRELSGFRDEHMIETIAAALSLRERVLAVVGASHVVRQEARLREVIRRRCR